MKILRMDRRKGKSTELIKLSNEKWYYIVCANRQRALQLDSQSQQMGLEIPFPITVNELPITSPYIRGLLIDDVDEVLQTLCGTSNIIQCTTSCEVELK